MWSPFASRRPRRKSDIRWEVRRQTQSTPRCLSMTISVQAAHEAVAQHDVAGAEQIPEGPEQPELALPLAGVPADAQVEDGPGGQREDGREARQREPQAGLLGVGLGVLGLVGRRVRHRGVRPVVDVDAAALPQPLRVGTPVQSPPGSAGQVRDEPLGQPPAGLAVRAGLGRAGALPAGGAVGGQASDRGPAGGVGAEDLAEEDPQRDQGRVDPVYPGDVVRPQGPGDEILREDVGERQSAALQELAA